MNGVITWQSTPDYDEWGYDSFWSCADWITWYKELKNHYPTDQAKQKFVTGWNGSDSYGHETVCLLDPDFANYFRSQGINIDNTLTAFVVGVQDIVEHGVDAGVNVSKFLKNIAPLAVIGVGLYFAAPYLIKLLAFKK
tara:strand:+ start:944 stop:1357 length:414 start_codon:yes stop_codon:yes gene_type:complete